MASLSSTTIRVSGLRFRFRRRLFLTAKLRFRNWVEALLSLIVERGAEIAVPHYNMTGITIG